MDEFSRHGKVEVAGLKAGMSRKTASKYLREGKLPSELAKPRGWRTRLDPFEEVWPEITRRLADAPELEAKTLFEDLMERRPGSFCPGQLRTLQRRVKQWRAEEGPDKRVFFPQLHRPGEAAQTDFTWATELGITIGGEKFGHMLCHFVLPYSNWEWATVCHSESLLALKHGVQEAVFHLGRVPTYHQTDHSTAATHKLSDAARQGDTKEERGFNEDYLALMKHLGLTPRTIQVGEKEQNGDVESLNGSLKRRLVQHLLLRGSRDFDSVPQYERWLQGVIRKANAQRSTKVAEELDEMKLLRVERLREYQEICVSVTSWSTIRVKRNAYSVPSRLMRERVRVRLFENRLEVYFGNKHQLTCDRLRGDGGSLINYRHIISSLVRKPGAFERYRYREDLFPSLVFRKSYDALCKKLSSRKADVEYLRNLNLAATTMESTVEVALESLLANGELPVSDRVKELVAPEEPEVPEIAVLEVDLDAYDELFSVDAGELVEVGS
jgi:transposase InsO family protein